MKKRTPPYGLYSFNPVTTTTGKISFPFGGRFGDIALPLALLKYNFLVLNVRLAGKHFRINCLCFFLSLLTPSLCLSFLLSALKVAVPLSPSSSCSSAADQLLSNHEHAL